MLYTCSVYHVHPVHWLILILKAGLKYGSETIAHTYNTVCFPYLVKRGEGRGGEGRGREGREGEGRGGRGREGRGGELL